MTIGIPARVFAAGLLVTAIAVGTGCGDGGSDAATTGTGGGPGGAASPICNSEFVAYATTAVWENRVPGARFAISVNLAQCAAPTQFTVVAARVDGAPLTVVKSDLCNCSDAAQNAACETSPCAAGANIRLWVAEIPAAGSQLLELDVAVNGTVQTMTVGVEACTSDPVCFGMQCGRAEASCAGYVCTPSCGTRVCGADGCGGECGVCATGTTCVAGSCVTSTTCANGCQVGSVCCGGAFCGGDCVGSPCC